MLCTLGQFSDSVDRARVSSDSTERWPLHGQDAATRNKRSAVMTGESSGRYCDGSFPAGSNNNPSIALGGARGALLFCA